MERSVELWFPTSLNGLRPNKGLGVVQRGGLDGGEWRGGFYATDNAEHAEAVTLQHGDFKDCVVPTWRISDKEPTDLKQGPAIPADAKWKFSG